MRSLHGNVGDTCAMIRENAAPPISIMMPIHEPARETPVVHECDLCVIGGSCTGIFAAVRAARLGLSVAIIEQNTMLGGMAAAAQVNEWHSLMDEGERRQIIGGLTVEVLERLRKRNAVVERRRQRGPFHLFNSTELALELEALVREHGIRLFLKTSCVAAARTENRVEAAIVEDKSGRRAIRGRIFIDASGDGDLLRRAGFGAWQNPTLQPVTYQMVVAGMNRMREEKGKHVWDLIRHRAEEFNYPLENATPWINEVVAPADLNNVYGPRLNGVDASDADQLTEALLESRRRHRILLDMVRAELGTAVAPVSMAQALGVRETWHARCRHQLTAKELLFGEPFPDAIANGTYPVDVHSAEGTLLRYMDGREEVIARNAGTTWRRWREESVENPAYYQVPYRCLVPEEAENLLVAGRLLDADREAFGGVRVMVNMNQTGEAAGTAAWLALKNGVTPAEVDTAQLRKTLADGGSIVL